MCRRLVHALTLSMVGLLMSCSGESGSNAMPGKLEGWAQRWDPTLRQHQTGIAAIQAELGTLARIPAEQTGERLGYHSRILNDRTELWVQMDLQSDQAIEQIVLVPVVLPKEQGGIAGYGFPQRFRVDLSHHSNMEEAVTVWDQSIESYPNPGRKPFIISCGDARARYIRLTVLTHGTTGTTLSSKLLALAEIMVLRGDVNLAAGRPVQAPTSRDAHPVWSLQNLTDSQSILGPPEGAVFTRECGWHSEVFTTQDVPQDITLTWPTPQRLEDLRLFPLKWKGYPHWVGFGFPLRFQVLAYANNDPQTTPRILADHTAQDFPNPGLNPVVIPMDRAPVQRVVIRATRQWERFNDYACAMAEVQAFAGGENVAAQSAVTTTTTYSRDARKPWSHENLLDGNTAQHPILPLNTWLQQIQRSLKLEEDLTTLQSAHTHRLAQWRGWVITGSGVLTGLAFLSVGLIALRSSLRRRGELRHLRERIARDLHDEVGSNLAGIGLLGREGARQTEGAVSEAFAEIQQVAEETAGSMRDLVWMIQPGSPGDLVNGLRQTAERLLRGMELHFHVPEKTFPSHITPDFKREVYLMFREALQNICRHSKAHRVDVHLSRESGSFRMNIKDDGLGFDPQEQLGTGSGLTNLRERARRIGGRCEIRSTPGAGTEVEVQAPW